MKTFVLLVALVAAVYGAAVPPEMMHTAWGYHERFGIPRAEELRALEEAQVAERIVGGFPSSLGQFPYQAGLLLDIVGLHGNGLCGGSLISADRILTAAHCWFDGQNQAWRVTVILGSVNIFFGGTRMQSEDVVLHSNWFPLLARNDVAMIRLPNSVEQSNNISPINLPSGSQLNELFTFEMATASGFGRTSGTGPFNNNVLNHVTVPIIDNQGCAARFPLSAVVHSTNICTGGAMEMGTCQGDSGGPLTITRNGTPLLIGVTSFGHPAGCESSNPAAYARVTSFEPWIREHM